MFLLLLILLLLLLIVLYSCGGYQLSLKRGEQVSDDVLVAVDFVSVCSGGENINCPSRKENRSVLLLLPYLMSLLLMLLDCGAPDVVRGLSAFYCIFVFVRRFLVVAAVQLLLHKRLDLAWTKISQDYPT